MEEKIREVLQLLKEESVFERGECEIQKENEIIFNQIKI